MIEERTGIGTAQYDAEAGPTPTATGGLLDRAPLSITDDLCLCMDVFTVVSEAVCERQRERVRHQQTIQKGLKNRLDLVSGDYKIMYRKIINGLETGAASLQPSENNRWALLSVCDLYFGFMSLLFRELTLRELPELLAPPHCFIAVLDSPRWPCNYANSVRRRGRRSWWSRFVQLAVSTRQSHS